MMILYIIDILIFLGLSIVLSFLTLAVGFCIFYAIMSFRIKIDEPLKKDVAVTNRFAVIIPAYNEERTITSCIESVKEQKYPLDHIDIIVIADNCTDRTADLSRELGATCLERHNPQLRGKGHALNWAFHLVPLDNYDAVVIIDADSVVDKDYFYYMNQHLEKGSLVIQAVNGVQNPAESWLTKIYDIVKRMRVMIFYRPASMINRSCQLFGLGMCFHVSVIKRFYWPSFSIAEDLEFYAILVENNILPVFSERAIVRSTMERTLKDSYTQRVRWSSGKFKIVRSYGLRLLWRGFIEGNWFKIGAGINIIFPSYSLTLNMLLGSIILNLFLVQNVFFHYWSSFLLILFFSHLTIGLFKLRLPLKDYRVILFSPVIIGWKAIIDTLGFFGYRSGQWTRTKR